MKEHQIIHKNTDIITKFQIQNKDTVPSTEAEKP